MKKLIGSVLTLGEPAIYLKIPKSTLFKLVRENNIQPKKTGRHWRFWKRSLERWLAWTGKTDSSVQGSFAIVTHIRPVTACVISPVVLWW
jgi:excisionase family DNA binding protein